jgi:hypothetical protein
MRVKMGLMRVEPVWLNALAALLALCLLLLGAPVTRASADVVTDPRNGVALFGYDAVAYHLEGAAKAGSPVFQATHKGILWRFSKEANLRAFELDPESYMPRFEGHAADALARGVFAAGDPEMFVVADGRVVLFRSEEARDAFVASPSQMMDLQERWRTLPASLR